MTAVSLWTASDPRRRHCSHSTWLSLPSCVAVSLQVQLYHSVCKSQLPGPTCCTSINICQARGLLISLTSGFRTSQGRLLAHDKMFCFPSKGWSSGLSRFSRITWFRHQNLITNLDQVTCIMKSSTYSKHSLWSYTKMWSLIFYCFLWLDAV